MALYWPATGYDFINYDDPEYVTANRHVQGGLTWESIRWAWLNPVCCNWHPLTVWSHMAVCQMSGLNPWGHHLTNVVLHAFNAGLVFALLQLMTGATWRSLLVAALFAVHPLRVESVAWVSERKDVLSGFFGLLALWPMPATRKGECRMQNAECRASDTRAARNTFHVSRFTFHASPKRVLPPFPVLLRPGPDEQADAGDVAVRDVAAGLLAAGENAECRISDAERSTATRSTRSHAPRSLRLLVTEKLPFFALAALASVVTFVVQQHGGALMAGESLPLGDARRERPDFVLPLSGEAVLANGFGRFLSAPRVLAAGEGAAGGWVDPGPFGAGLECGGGGIPYLLMGWLWFVGMLVPVIGLVQAGGQAMADRYTYLPSLGVLILAIWGACELTRGWRYQVMALSVAGGGGDRPLPGVDAATARAIGRTVKPCSGMRSKSRRTITSRTTTSASPSAGKAKLTRRSANTRKPSA